MDAHITIVPAKGSHAVTGVVFVWELVGPPTAEELKKFAAVYETDEKFRLTFGSMTAERTGGELGEDGPQNSAVHSDTISGLVFERKVGEVVEWTLTVGQDAVVVACYSYLGWDKTAELALEYGRLVFKHVPSLTVEVVGLQYLDKFIITGQRDKYDHQAIFASDNPFLAPVAYKKAGSWHNFIGWYQYDCFGLAKVLSNLNVGMVESLEPWKAEVTIANAHRSFQHEAAQAVTNEEAWKTGTSAQFAALAKMNKKLLSELLCKSLRERIGLSYKEQENA